MRRCAVIMLFALLAGCSSPPPPQSFLNASVRIRTIDGGNSNTELLRIKPIDVFNSFDKNIIEKKWKKVDDTSWSFVFKGKDPSTSQTNNIAITFSYMPELNNDVVVTKVRINYTDYTPAMVADVMRQFDTFFAPRK